MDPTFTTAAKNESYLHHGGWKWVLLSLRQLKMWPKKKKNCRSEEKIPKFFLAIVYYSMHSFFDSPWLPTPLFSFVVGSVSDSGTGKVGFGLLSSEKATLTLLFIKVLWPLLFLTPIILCKKTVEVTMDPSILTNHKRPRVPNSACKKFTLTPFILFH